MLISSMLNLLTKNTIRSSKFVIFNKLNYMHMAFLSQNQYIDEPTFHWNVNLGKT